ncbi:MAG: hypothetical protein QXZ25_00210 [Candidatus Bathyarchaeia archaeon]
MDLTVSLSAAEICAILGFSVGFLWGESFSSFDGKIKYYSSWFKQLSPFKKWLVASAFDAMHHFQYGLMLMLFVMEFAAALPLMVRQLLLWVGWGLVASDWKDYANVLRRLGLSKGASA